MVIVCITGRGFPRNIFLFFDALARRKSKGGVKAGNDKVERPREDAVLKGRFQEIPVSWEQKTAFRDVLSEGG